jgi:hypothetical protein
MCDTTCLVKSDREHDLYHRVWLYSEKSVLNVRYSVGGGGDDGTPATATARSVAVPADAIGSVLYLCLTYFTLPSLQKIILASRLIHFHGSLVAI